MQEDVLKLAFGSGARQVQGMRIPGWIRVKIPSLQEPKPLFREDERDSALAELHHTSNVESLGLNISELYLPGARL